MTTLPRWIPITIGLLGFSGVALGAFGAHALKAVLTERGTLAAWQTAVQYQLIHSVALLAAANWVTRPNAFTWIARCWLGGIVLFSGSLYWLALGGPKFLGPITPLGGLGFLAGWLIFARHALLPPHKAQ